MLTEILVVLVIVFFAVRFYKDAYERPPNFPPGPPRLPIWGSYWLLLFQNYKYSHKAMLEMARRYSTKVVGFYLGCFPSIAACSYEAVKEVLTRTEFAARPDIVLVRARAFGERLGIFFTDGRPWVEQRRFMLRNMRDFGFGRRFQKAELAMAEEVSELLALLRGEWHDEAVEKDGCVCFPWALHPTFVNMIWTMMSGQRFSRPELNIVREITSSSTSFVQATDMTGGAVSQTPWLLHVAPEATGVPQIVRSTHLIGDHIKKSFEYHEKTFSEDHFRDFIDRYILEMRKEGIKKQTSFTLEQLQLVGADLMIASATTTTSTLTFTFMALLNYPEVQRRCQEEIDKVVGRDRLPTLDDRPSMPYTEATIRESMRRNTILPLALPHFCTEDTELQGHNVPKNTVVFANTYAIHMDPDLWGDPKNFRPERFLDDEGKLKKDITFPFGAGKRLCPGETFSRQSMFVVFASLLQSFTFEPADPKSVLSLDTETPGLTITPPNLWLRAVPRQ